MIAFDLVVLIEVC